MLNVGHNVCIDFSLNIKEEPPMRLSNTIDTLYVTTLFIYILQLEISNLMMNGFTDFVFSRLFTQKNVHLTTNQGLEKNKPLIAIKCFNLNITWVLFLVILRVS